MHLGQVVTNFLLAYLFLIILEKDLYWLGAAFLFSHGITLILLLFHQVMTLPILIKLKYFLVVAKIAFPLTPRVLIGFVGTQFDKIILSQVSSLDALGIYSIAHRISMTIYMFMNALGRVWTPKLYEYLFENNSKKENSFLSLYMYISLFPALVLILFSQEVLIVFPDSYSWAFVVIILLCLYYSVLFIGKINGPQLIFAKKNMAFIRFKFCKYYI